MAKGGVLLTRMSLSADHGEGSIHVPEKPEAATENEISSYHGVGTPW
jgi:hypothetical protein